MRIDVNKKYVLSFFQFFLETGELIVASLTADQAAFPSTKPQNHDGQKDKGHPTYRTRGPGSHRRRAQK